MQPQDPNTQPQPQPSPEPYQAPAEAYTSQSPVPPRQPYAAPTAPEPEVKNPLATMRPGEKVVCEIKRHPIGIINMYIGIGLLLLLVAVVGYVVAPALFTEYSKSQVYGGVSIVMLVAVLFSLLFLVVGHIVYWGNRWIVTDDSITQVVQNSLFSKQSSQLSMANLEDITAEQNGILAHMFNYGLLKAETAGEHSKFRFMYCPNPTYYAQQILQARETFEQENYRAGQSGQSGQQYQGNPQQ